MSGVIKFRVRLDGEWIYWEVGDKSNWFWEKVREYDLTPFQYTGLKDKKGKEIYEGDVILKEEYFEDSEGIKYQIVFDSIGFSKTVGFHAIDNHENLYDFYGGLPPLEKISVIGNIYEHPNRLEE